MIHEHIRESPVPGRGMPESLSQILDRVFWKVVETFKKGKIIIF